MGSRQGQAALEFLSTYGWAVLVMAIVLVALAWLGVFNVANKTPDRCTMQGGLQCDSALLRNGLVLNSLVVTSRLTDNIYVCALRCTNNPDKNAVADVDNCPGTGAKLAPGAQMDIVKRLSNTSIPRCYDYFAGVSGTGRYSVGDTYSGRVEVYYSNDYDDAKYKARIFYGDVALKVQA